MQRSTIKGWSEQHESGIYAAEIQDLSQEELTVKTFSGQQIAKGLYADIKDQVKQAGGKYTASVYAMTESGEIINLQLKGISLKQWMEFTQKSKSRLADEWAQIKEIGEGKKGSVNFTFPVFEYNGTLTDDFAQLADETYDALKEKLSPSARKVDLVEAETDDQGAVDAEIDETDFE